MKPIIDLPGLVTCCVAAMAIAGCAHGPEKTAENGSETARVVVISAFGEDMRSIKLATFSDNHITNSRSVADWNLNRRLSAVAAEALRAAGTFELAQADYDADALGADLRNDASGLTLTSGLRASAGALRSIAKQAGANRILLLRPAHVLDSRFSTTHVFSGYGVAYRSVNAVKQTGTYLAIAVDLLDADSLEAVNQRRLLQVQPASQGFYQPLAENYSDPDLASICEALVNLGRQAVNETLNLAPQKSS